MAIDSRYYIHEDDKAALDALKAIPGFTPLIKAFMKNWNENQFRILNMSSRLRISEQQLPKYYRMLGPICEKLGIEVPELYIEMNVRPNAYTYGDTKPFIVMTSGLLDALPEELIPTVLAHECGHIACHHTLYRTMGSLILGGAAAIPGLGTMLTLPLQIAFAYWMRCSEFSADRAAILCEGNPENVIELCMRLSGYTKNITETAQKDLFLQQAVEYKELIKDNVLNQTMEFMLLAGQSHPMTAVRAYEANEWGKSDNVAKLLRYYAEEEAGQPHTVLPVSLSSDGMKGMNGEALKKLLNEAGFTDVTSQRTTQGDGAPESISSVSFNGTEEFHAGTWFDVNTPIVLTCYIPLSAEEEKALHPNEVQVPFRSRSVIGRDYSEVCMELVHAGFKNIFTVYSEDDRPLFSKDGGISRIEIGETDTFEQGDWFAPETKIRVIHY